MVDAPTTTDWDRAVRAMEIFAVDPAGVGGLWLRARSGPARDQILAALDMLNLAARKLHPSIAEEQLFGGLDLSATLDAGRLVQSAGLLAAPGPLILTLAERCPARLAAHLGQVCDTGTHPVIALDEGAEPDETPPPALTERLGLFVGLNSIPMCAIGDLAKSDAVFAARDRLNGIEHSDADVRHLVELATVLGIGSLRAPIMGLAAARANAALFGRNRVTLDDLTTATELVLAHRATVLPAEDDAPPQGDEEDLQQAENPETNGTANEIPADVLLEAVRTALPSDVLASLAEGRAARARSGAAGSGSKRKGNRRGRPLPSRPGVPDGERRIDLVATLRAAAPWQPMRRVAASAEHRIHIRRSDLRVRRFQETSDRLLIFAVDASGSQAMTRLAEAKGAVELLLAQAYARRDHVALISFRGEGADLLLPPTRSLVQAKRRLQGLPGGGGTPLAAGLRLASEIAAHATRQGMTPTLALLTDGRANIALDGTANRKAAGADADRVARSFGAMGTPALIIDTAPRPQRGLSDLAVAAGGSYIALPRADAHRLSSAVMAAMPE
ncbi:MAG: magnesium chelatase subunit D [Pseudomonadota bacterium]